MTVPDGSLRSGLDYVAAYLDHEGTVTVVDVGRDDIHDAPLLITTWDAETHPEDGPFVHAAFGPEHMACAYTPEENVRVMYVHEPVADHDDTVGDWKAVTFVVDRSLRVRFREHTEWYDHDDDGVDRLLELLA